VTENLKSFAKFFKLNKALHIGRSFGYFSPAGMEGQIQKHLRLPPLTPRGLWAWVSDARQKHLRLLPWGLSVRVSQMRCSPLLKQSTNKVIPLPPFHPSLSLRLCLAKRGSSLGNQSDHMWVWHCSFNPSPRGSRGPFLSFPWGSNEQGLFLGLKGINCTPQIYPPQSSHTNPPPPPITLFFIIRKNQHRTTVAMSPIINI
jgi:hypothetical protein